MKALIVGAGAVGQVYARHLKLAGCEVHLYVKAKYAEEAARGYALYPLNRSSAREAPVRFTPDGVVTTPDEAARSKWDQVYLCMSSTGLRGAWLADFARAVKGATVVTLQPGLDDLAVLREHFAEDELVSGMISLISYHAPLPGERVPEPGMAYWFPPLSPSPFSGARAKDVVATLSRGGLPAKVARDVPTEVAFPSAALMALISALEASDWSFDRLKKGKNLKDACVASAEAFALISRKLGKKRPLGLALLKPTMLRAVLGVAPCVVPLDLETYFKVHFTKVGDQTRLFMRGYIDTGRELGLPTPALERLTASLS